MNIYFINIVAICISVMIYINERETKQFVGFCFICGFTMWKYVIDMHGLLALRTQPIGNSAALSKLASHSFLFMFWSFPATLQTGDDIQESDLSPSFPHPTSLIPLSTELM